MRRHVRRPSPHDHTRDTVYDLRHFYASALIVGNVHPKVVQARLGHATLSETMDTYAHLFHDTEDLGSLAVDKALAGALAEQRRNRTSCEAPDD